MKSPLILLVALAVCPVGLVQAESAFLDKRCASYASPNDETGKPMEIPWRKLDPNDFGSRAVTFDPAGVRPLRQVPAPGVHPRILFTAEDLPEIRQRLKTTQCGQAAWKNLLCWTEMMKGRYDDQADYAKPDVWKGGFSGLHGRVPLFRLGMKGGYNKNPSGRYQKLIQGETGEAPGFLWNVFSLEAFRCLVDQDAPAAQDLAKAVITALKIDQAARDAERKAKGQSGPPDQPVGAFQLAFTYDFIHQWLTPEQRQAMHDELALGTWHHDNYGTFNDATASRSNWATFSYWLFEVLAIEGEPGFNDLKVRGMYRGWRNLLTYGWFQSGATFEGEAKNQLGMDGIIMFALRKQLYGFDDLCGHPYLKAYATRFLPHSVIPTRDAFVKYDLLGGSRCKGAGANTGDLIGLKYMFPGDKTIDWLFRCTIGENYENVPDRPDGYYNGLLFAAIFATDFDPANNDPAKLALGNTFFCGERALMMTRSGWDKDALMLNLHTREANGGHASADRNCLMLAGAGRVWSPVQGGRAFENFKNSVVVIDGKPQDLNVPGRMVDFQDTALATFAVGDAKYTWDWNHSVAKKAGNAFTVEDVAAGRVVIPPGWEKEEHSVNDFSYTKLPFAYLNWPMFEARHWCLKKGYVSPVVRQPNHPVQKAFRTAGIVRGPHPYALVVDDIRKDDAVHHYDWILTLEPDLQMIRGAKGYDVFLTGSDPTQSKPKAKEPLPPEAEAGKPIPTGQPVLLVRVLNRTQESAVTAAPTIDTTPVPTGSRADGVRRLILPADAVSPDYKVLLYPFRMGEPLPKTTWNAAHTAVTIEIGGVRDTVIFSPSKSGKTDVSIARGTTPLIAVNREIAPLKDAALERRAAQIEQLRKDLAGFDPESISGRIPVPAFTGVKLAKGKVGQAVKFDGSAEGVPLPLDMKALGANSFSLVFWICAPEAAGNFLECNSPKGLGLSIENGKALRSDALGSYRWGGNTPMDFKEWHQLAFTSDGKMLTLFVDGKPVKSAEIDNKLQLSPNTRLGANCTGMMDDLRVYNRALTPVELEKLFNFQAHVQSAK